MSPHAAIVDVVQKWVPRVIALQVAVILLFVWVIVQQNQNSIEGCDRNNRTLVGPMRDFTASAADARRADGDYNVAREYDRYAAQLSYELSLDCSSLYQIVPDATPWDGLAPW